MSPYVTVQNRLLEHPLAYRLRQLVVDKQQTVAALHELTGDLRGKAILELGCGPGTNVAQFRAAASYLGVDINPDYIATARKRHPERDFVASDAVVFDPPARQDVVVIDSFLHHVDDPSTERILVSAARWLAPGGFIIVQEPVRPERNELYHRLMMSLDRGNHFRKLDHWRALMRQSGLTVQREQLCTLWFLGLKSHHMVSMRLGCGD